MFTLCGYALFKDYKRNSIEAMAKAAHTDYLSACNAQADQKLQYFFSNSQWDLQAIKQNFKDKLHIAQELFGKSLEALEFSAVTFDSWYATTNLLVCSYFWQVEHVE